MLPSDGQLDLDDLKHYPHFDAPIPLKKVRKLVKNEQRVIKNAFYPFIRYTKSYTPFNEKHAPSSEKKERLIRYSARRDAYIYTHYRKKLSVHYENELSRLKISAAPVAYRKIPCQHNPEKGKCNIDFAKDAFDEINKMGDCIAIVLDISSYFENIDHNRLHGLVRRTLKCKTLPKDYEVILKNITQYHYVDKIEVYKRLGYFGKIKDNNGIWRDGYKVPYQQIMKQLCTPQQFREKICGKNPKYPSLIKKNKLDRGIPQGAPISDLLANLYLIDFDKKMCDFALKKNGKYWRYSDDILLLVPHDSDDGISVSQFVTNEIKRHGSHLIIKPKKTSIVKYTKTTCGQTFKKIHGRQGNNGLEYLGFRFDGKSVYLRDSTISGFYRKMTFGSRKEAYTFASRNTHLSKSQLIQKFNYKKFFQKYGRVSNFDKYASEPNKWTFWTYVTRSAEAFADYGNKIPKQVSRHKKFLRSLIEQELKKAHDKI